jgi:hypothetical protein
MFNICKDIYNKKYIWLILTLQNTSEFLETYITASYMRLGIKR